MFTGIDIDGRNIAFREPSSCRSRSIHSRLGRASCRYGISDKFSVHYRKGWFGLLLVRVHPYRVGRFISLAPTEKTWELHRIESGSAIRAIWTLPVGRREIRDGILFWRRIWVRVSNEFSPSHLHFIFTSSRFVGVTLRTRGGIESIKSRWACVLVIWMDGWQKGWSIMKFNLPLCNSLLFFSPNLCRRVPNRRRWIFFNNWTII